MDTIGFIGLGKMGGSMARNLLAAGYKLVVCDVDRSRVAPLVEAGAKEAGSPKDVAAQTDLLITMLPSSPQVEEVLCGASGILAGAKKGCTVVDMSTGDPVVTRRLAKIAAQSGVEMLDAPVTGGTKGAAGGTLTIMTGGRKEKVEELRPVFEAMGKRIVYAGDIGMGLAVKLCNQLVMSVTLVAVHEAWLFGTRLGADPQTIYEVVTHGTGGCWVLDNYVEHLGILPEPDKARMTEVGNNAIMIKDLGLVMSAAKELALPLPTAGAAHQIFLAMRANGLGNEDLWALGTVLRRLAGEEN